MKLENRTALVTGGASGIGRAIATQFVREGATVVINHYNTLMEAEAVVAELNNIRPNSAYYTEADVSDAAQVDAMVEKAKEILGKIDILVCSHGIDQKISIQEMTVEDFDRMIAIDLRGVFLCNKAVIPGMLENGWGRIINVTSQLGQIGGALTSHYAAAKAGVIAFTKSLAYELSKQNVLCNCIAPGPIRTPILDMCPDEFLIPKLASMPIGREGTVWEVAPTAVLLASDPDGSFYCGQTLGPNGGDVML